MEIIKANLGHLLTDHGIAVAVMGALFITVVISFRVIYVMSQKIKKSDKLCLKLTEEISEAIQANSDSAKLIEALKKKVRDIEGAVTQGVTDALIELNLKAVSLETFGEIDDEARSADTNMTAEEEAELDDLHPDDENVRDKECV